MRDSSKIPVTEETMAVLRLFGIFLAIWVSDLQFAKSRIKHLNVRVAQTLYEIGQGWRKP